MKAYLPFNMLGSGQVCSLEGNINSGFNFLSKSLFRSWFLLIRSYVFSEAVASSFLISNFDLISLMK